MHEQFLQNIIVEFKAYKTLHGLTWSHVEGVQRTLYWYVNSSFMYVRCSSMYHLNKTFHWKSQISWITPADRIQNKFILNQIIQNWIDLPNSKVLCYLSLKTHFSVNWSFKITCSIHQLSVNNKVTTRDENLALFKVRFGLPAHPFSTLKLQPENHAKLGFVSL